ncbi:recombinase family protein [Salmonella enterica]|nr:recombinase family protein [Salmonella enterica]
MRTFAYCRVSTTEQDANTQSHHIKERYPDLIDTRIESEKVSGSVAAGSREKFMRLLDRMESGDRLVVWKLDRLGRDAIDVINTVRNLKDRGIKVICLDIGEVDLTSAAGQLVFGVMCQFAEFERNRIIERTREAQARARAEGKQVGRPVAVDTTKAVQKCKAEELTQSQTAEKLGVSLRTVKNHWNK